MGMRHRSFIGSQQTLRQGLLPLQDALQARCASHRALVRLRGRLKLLRDLGRQVAETGPAETRDTETSIDPLHTYVEGDSDDGASAEEVEEDNDDCGSESGDASDSDDALAEFLDSD